MSRINGNGMSPDVHGYNTNSNFLVNEDPRDYLNRDSLEEDHALLDGRPLSKRFFSFRVLVVICILLSICDILLLYFTLDHYFRFITPGDEYSIGSSSIDLGVSGCVRVVLAFWTFLLLYKLSKVDGSQVSRPKAKRMYFWTLLSWCVIGFAAGTIGFGIIKIISIALNVEPPCPSPPPILQSYQPSRTFPNLQSPSPSPSAFVPSLAMPHYSFPSVTSPSSPSEIRLALYLMSAASICLGIVEGCFQRITAKRACEHLIDIDEVIVLR